ncbi:LysR family transcriptional regulator [Tomitella fengzijianii]|uniref:LysR family transcriptional regulator n=1 Tax=Tomitella fengzijianii TaxID=2597660 RepID=A0A516X6S6_9ACTN|nr:LysR family transcriptional regulator [Tomitella fengzijianii]QDQ98766.1 LysR family transcriptional regulator [Tomitella fengzijianii]
MTTTRIDLLRHWAIFVAVAEEGHFGAAADRLAMTQPSVSQGLRRLEDRVGLQLIDRGARAAVVTAEGRRVLPLARTLLRDAEHLAAEAGRIAARGGTLECGVAAAVPTSAVAGAVAALAASGARVEARRATCPRIVDAVGTGEMACGVVEDPTPYADLARGRLHRLPRVLLVPAGWGPSARRRLDWARLAGHHLVTTPRDECPAAHDLLVDLVAARLPLPRVVQVDRAWDIVGRIAGGEGYAVVDAAFARASGLAWRALPREFDLRLRAVVHPERQTDHAQRDVRAVLDEALAAAARDAVSAGTAVGDCDD